MEPLIEIAAKLTPGQLKQVEDFAKSLLQRRQETTTIVGLDEGNSQKKINFEGWAGCLAHVDPEKSDKELLREAWDELIAKMEK